MNKEFYINQTIHALGQFLEYGEKEYLHSHQGYFSGDGWAARCLRSHVAFLSNHIEILKLIIELIGGMSEADLSRLVGEKKAKMINSWYFDNRAEYR